QPYLPLIRRYRLFIREGLLRFARNDNGQYVTKDIASVIARVLSEAISRFHNGELVAAVPRYGIYILNHGVTQIYFTWNTSLRHTFMGRASMDKKRNDVRAYLIMPSFSNTTLFLAFIKRYGSAIPIKK
ncbi:MAG: hypothetical protein BROFUL_00511, partial [Candidatus Brocadia fulgida]